MAKRKINAKMLLAAGEQAHLQINNNVSHANNSNEEYLIELDVSLIKDNPMQPRIQVTQLDDLKRSIKLHGLIQPISVVLLNDGEYILKAGQRRLLAHKELKIEKIKALVKKDYITSEKEKKQKYFEIAVIENDQRENLKVLELALSIKNAMDNNLYKNMDEISTKLGKSKSYISKILKILKLDKTIIEDLHLNKSTNDVEALYEIQKIKDIDKQIKIYNDFILRKIDRKFLRDFNKKKEIQSVNYKKNKKSLKLDLSLNNLSEKLKQNLELDIEKILKKYYNYNN